ncbi:Uma2 family endonuclease [Streptomyces sp. NPDC088725]|uniref:Uma2 family endonuclease n=1 Tax=Streptomyces sp. NPDC088725 TaxID=3365873 RepID=UPI00382170FB
MTAIADRPHLLSEQFEAVARSLSREAEELRPEFIYGRLGVKPVPDGDHGRIIQWLTRICIQARPELWLHDQGLRVETYRAGRARPDGVLAPADAFVGAGEWADASAVLMAVEVTSYDSDTDRRDRVEKPRAYAESGIPVHLLIDRDACEVIVHSEPDGVRYERSARIPFGKRVELPGPVGIVLDTEVLKGWVR